MEWWKSSSPTDVPEIKVSLNILHLITNKTTNQAYYIWNPILDPSSRICFNQQEHWLKIVKVSFVKWYVPQYLIEIKFSPRAPFWLTTALPFTTTFYNFLHYLSSFVDVSQPKRDRITEKEWSVKLSISIFPTLFILLCRSLWAESYSNSFRWIESINEEALTKNVNTNLQCRPTSH